jgi:hypothetical protein
VPERAFKALVYAIRRDVIDVTGLIISFSIALVIRRGVML